MLKCIFIYQLNKPKELYKNILNENNSPVYYAKQIKYQNKKARLQTQKSESNTYHYNRYYGNKEYHLNMPWLMDVNEMWNNRKDI